MGIKATDPLFSDMIDSGEVPYYPISRLACFGPEKTSGDPAPGPPTWRPLQTITPLANAVFPSIAVTNPYDYRVPNELIFQFPDDQPTDEPGDYSLLVDEIMDGSNEDKTVVLCWESTALPFMLAGLDFGMTSYTSIDPRPW